MSKPRTAEEAIPITQACVGMVIKLNMIQVWCKKDGRVVPYSHTLIIEGIGVEPATQVAELQDYFLDVRVVRIELVFAEQDDIPTLVKVVHCDDLAEKHTIYLMPEEIVTVIDRFNPSSKRLQKRNKSHNPAAGARRQ